MIEIRNERPKNREHFSRLLVFGKEVIAICRDLGITPVLTGSLAVFAYTHNQAMSVNDIDLACSELEFPRLGRALSAKRISHELKEWHVLRARKDDLKVELDSMKYWMADLPEEYDTLVIDGCTLQIVSLSSLRELYRRGLEATAGQGDEGNRAKHLALAEKFDSLLDVEARRPGLYERRGCDFCGRSEIALREQMLDGSPVLELDEDGLWVCPDCRARLVLPPVGEEARELEELQALVGQSAGAICHTLNLPYEFPYQTIIDAASRIAYDEDRFMSAWSFVTQWLDGTTVWRAEDGEAVTIVAADGSVRVRSHG